nr:hypothetical protein BaRGS_028211 [Batillaria attramentaria]
MKIVTQGRETQDEEETTGETGVENAVEQLQLEEGREVTEEEKALLENMITVTGRMCSTSEAMMERHMQGHRDEDRDGTYKCADCNRTYATRGGYMKHKRQGTCFKRDDLNDDGTVGDFRCALCDTRFKTESLLKLHISKSHESAGSKFECKDCGRVFYSKQGFAKHESAKSCTQPLRCLVCGKMYSNKARESFKPKGKSGEGGEQELVMEDNTVMVDGEVTHSDGQAELTEGQLQHVVMQAEGMTEPMVIHVIRDLTGRCHRLPAGGDGWADDEDRLHEDRLQV